MCTKFFAMLIYLSIWDNTAQEKHVWSNIKMENVGF